MRLKLSIIVFLVFGWSLVGFAKDIKKTTIDFEDELFSGKADKPELLYFTKGQEFNSNSLIFRRTNFLPQMRKTAEEIQRVRGK